MNEALPLYFKVEVKSGVSWVDITPYISLDADNPEMTSALDSEMDTLTLVVDEGDDLDLHSWQEIRVWDLHTGDMVAFPQTIFGGYILTIDPAAADNLTKNKFVLGCVDYSALLERSYVQLECVGKTDAEIIAAVFAAADPPLPTIDVTTHVDTLCTLARERYNRMTVKEILDQLCERSGGHWYLDIDLALFLHYFATESLAAPFNVSDDPLEAGCVVVEDLRSHQDGTDVVNVIEIVGGNHRSSDVVDEYSGTGYKRKLNLVSRTKPPTGETKIIVKRNDGGATTNLEVNPSFEVNITDGNTQSQAGTGAAWALDATKYVIGAKCLKITAGTGSARVYSGSITLAPGEAITVQCRAWCSVLGKAMILVATAGGSTLVSRTNRKTSSWELLTATYVNTTSASISVRRDLVNVAADSATITYFDAVQTEKLSWPTDYCDGTLGTGYAWTGTAHNSTSTRVAMAIWTTLTVKTGGDNDTLEGRNEVLYFETKAYLQQENYWPNLGNAVEVTGQHETPIRVQCQNDASYDHYGRWMKLVIVDTSIVDKGVGIMRARTELAKSAFDAVSLDYKTRSAGLRAGMLQHIDHTARNIHGDYVIQSVTTTIGVGGHIESQVSLGAANQTLVRYLLALRRKIKPKVEWDDTEVLDVILEMTETLTLAEGTPVLTVNDPPYLWGGVRWGLGAWE